MNKIFLFALFFGYLGLSSSVKGQELLARDTAMIKGQLKNGLTYYIQSNVRPKGKVAFRLLVNAGSTSESDAQQGLAHFLEHMAFKGSKNFPPGTLIPTLEEAGMKLGRDVNARTKTDETVYFLHVPTDKYQLGFRVIRDWAGELLLDSLMIEQERPVITEELRLGRGVSTRMREKYVPVLLGGSLYPQRFVIGKEEVIKTFSHSELWQFYRNCYRPDRMAVVIVGDLDEKLAEQEIVRLFSDIPKANMPLVLPDVRVPEHRELKIAVVTDPEAKSSVVQTYYKHPVQKIHTRSAFQKQLCHALFAAVLNMRLEELTEKAEAPFSEAEGGYGSYNRGCDVYSGYAEILAGREREAIRILHYEDKRMADHGVTPTELKQAKRKVFSGYERRYLNRLNLRSDEVADACQVDFMSDEPAVGIEARYILAKEMLAEISKRDIDRLSKEYFTKDNRVILLTAPAGRDIPDEREIREIVEKVERSKTVPYQHAPLPEELPVEISASGAIVSERFHADSEITEWKLSNGAQVFFKPTNVDNTVIFRAIKKGGYRGLLTEYDSSAMLATAVINRSGVGGMSFSQLRKILMGRSISLSPAIRQDEQSFTGYFSPSDIKEFFKLLYLYQTAPSFDSLVFQQVLAQNEEEKKSVENNPEDYFQREIQRVMGEKNENRNISAAPTLEKVKQAYHSLLGDPREMAYVFVGNLDVETIKSYIQLYLGGVPVHENSVTRAAPTLQYPDSSGEYLFRKGEAADKVSVEIKFIREAEWDEYKSYCLNIFMEMLSSRLFRVLREEMGGVYGVRLFDQVGREEDPYALFEISFGTNANLWKSVSERAIKELRVLTTEGASQEELNRVKEKRRQSFSDNIRDNRVWASRMIAAARYGDPQGALLRRGEIIERLTLDDIQEAAKSYLDPKRSFVFVLLPEIKIE